MDNPQLDITLAQDLDNASTSIIDLINFNDYKTLSLVIIVSIYYAIMLIIHLVAITYSIYLFNHSRNQSQTLTSVVNLSETNNSYNRRGSLPVSVDEPILQNLQSSNNYDTLSHVSNDSILEDNPLSLPHVVIIKPLHGKDANLEENLTSFLYQDYPNYSVVFCIGKENDESVEVARRVIANEEKRNASNSSSNSGMTAKNITIQIDYENVGPNPKINNMIKTWRKYKNTCKYIWTVDANIFALPGTLKDMVERIKTSGSDPNKNGVCHGMPYFKSSKNRKFGEIVEKTYFGTQHGRHYLFWNCLGQPCLNGQSNLINLEVFEKAVGDLSDLGGYIAEDYFLGKILWDHNFKLVLSRYPILQNPHHKVANTPSQSTLKRYYTRMIRWTRLRMTMIPLVSLLEPLTESTISGFLTSLCLFFIFQNTQYWYISLIALPIYLIIWFFLDCVLQFSMDSKFFKYDNIFKLFSAWLVREVMTIGIQVMAVLNVNSITWQGRNFNVSGVSGAARENSRNSRNPNNSSDASNDAATTTSSLPNSPIVNTDTSPVVGSLHVEQESPNRSRASSLDSTSSGCLSLEQDDRMCSVSPSSIQRPLISIDKSLSDNSDYIN